jgi:hypothetical protein
MHFEDGSGRFQCNVSTYMETTRFTRSPWNFISTFLHLDILRYVMPSRIPGDHTTSLLQTLGRLFN